MFSILLRNQSFTGLIYQNPPAATLSPLPSSSPSHPLYSRHRLFLSGLVYLTVLKRSGSADQLSMRTRGGMPLDIIRIRNLPFSGSTGWIVWPSRAAIDFVRFSAVSGSARSGIARCDCMPKKKGEKRSKVSPSLFNFNFNYFLSIPPPPCRNTKLASCSLGIGCHILARPNRPAAFLKRLSPWDTILFYFFRFSFHNDKLLDSNPLGPGSYQSRRC